MWACVWACVVGGGFRIFGQRAKSVNSATIRVLVGEDIHNSDLPVCTRYRLNDASNWPFVRWQVLVSSRGGGPYLQPTNPVRRTNPRRHPSGVPGNPKTFGARQFSSDPSTRTSVGAKLGRSSLQGAGVVARQASNQAECPLTDS